MAGGGEGRPGVSTAPQLSLISQNLLLLRKVPAPTAASLQCREQRMRNQDGSPLLSPLAPCALSGKDQGLPSLGLELWRSPTGRGGPWMSPRNFPEKARKSCLVSNHFPSHRPPFVPVQYSTGTPASYCFFSPCPSPNVPGGGRATIIPVQGPKREMKS